MKSSRQISLVDPVIFDINSKNLYKNAITLGDLDNDDHKVRKYNYLKLI